MSARTRALGDGAALSVALAVVVVLVSIPLRAPAPLSGDGCEIATNLAQGGVLHAPGFAVQAWLHRLVALLAAHGTGVVDGTGSVVALGIAAHALAAFFVAEALRVLGAGGWARTAGALAYALFPT